MAASFRRIKNIGLSILFFLILFIAGVSYYALDRVIHEIYSIKNIDHKKLEAIYSIRNEFIEANKTFLLNINVEMPFAESFKYKMDTLLEKCNQYSREYENNNKGKKPISILAKNAKKMKMLTSVFIESHYDKDFGDAFLEVIKLLNKLSSESVWLSTEIEDKIRLAITEKRNDIIDKTERSKIYLILLLAFSIVLGFIFILFFNKALLNPINSLIKATESASKGDFSTRLPEVHNDEIGKLTSAFNKMNTKIHNYTSELISKNIELIEANSKAKIAQEAKSEFLSNISHEMRTPLNGITGMVYLLETAITDKKQKEYLDVIKASSENLLHMISDILRFSELSYGLLKLKPDKVNFKDFIKKICYNYSEMNLKKDVDFIFEYDNTLPDFIYVQSSYVRQLLINLLSNAYKFTKQGYIKLSIKMINIDNNKKRIDLAIFIEDTGIGIPQEKQEEIFILFKQLDNVLTKRFKGIGLGLTLCKKIVEKLDGEIKVKSTPGKGSIFEIILKDLKIENSVDKKANPTNKISCDFSELENRELPIELFQNIEKNILPELKELLLIMNQEKLVLWLSSIEKTGVEFNIDIFKKLADLLSKKLESGEIFVVQDYLKLVYENLNQQLSK